MVILLSLSSGHPDMLRCWFLETVPLDTNFDFGRAAKYELFTTLTQHRILQLVKTFVYRYHT
jgi:hypothetical protein